MSTIEDVFEGEWKSPEEYLIMCPYCGDHKTHNHCYVNVVKGVFSCHYCGETGSLDRLMQDHGDGEQVEREPGMKEKDRHEELDLDQFKPITGMTSTMDRMALSYLTGRGFSRQEITDYKLLYSDFGRFYGRVIFPIVEFGATVCFIARSYIRPVHPKYLFPRHGETQLTTNECLWGWDEAMAKRPDRIIITEGVIDSMALRRVGDFSVSIHSKQIGQAQLMKLLRLPKTTQFVVMLDGDARKDGLKVAKVLAGYGRQTVMALLDNGEDPANITKERVDEVLKIRTFAVDVNLAMKVYLDG
jgi:5S rRNA maturation endonuclease (ribonuclease M5)